MLSAYQTNKRVLGIDLGLKRTGYAVSDELWLSVRPLPNHHAPSLQTQVQYITKLCEELEVGTVLIGFPQYYEKESVIAKRAQTLKKALDEEVVIKELPFKIHLRDESYSSKQAMNRLIQSQVKRTQRKVLLDSEAARIIVENFIQG